MMERLDKVDLAKSHPTKIGDGKANLHINLKE